MAAEKKPPRGKMARKRACEILDRLEQEHPDARVYLDYETPLQLLLATILAAQCTDEKVNEITPRLFERYPTAEELAKADREGLEALLRPTGFFRQKARSVQEACRVIAEEHGGEVPADREALTAISGVGRKTANIVLIEAFGQDAIAVDTHVKRLATRLGMTASKTVDAMEKDLCALIPEERWGRATLLLGTHGRRVCAAKKPDHEGCALNELCAFYRDMQSR